ncbi:4-phosphoerythronate dehydrogenase PdxB [Candidatus Sumerlaeota bacterium]|nr:4-phosphoerythronate dehydrogenase PdxB [Candidatus Sumerlaeota bacterium]
MKIICDENIPYGCEAFERLGDVRMMPGRAIDSAALRDAELLIVRSITRVNDALLDGTAVRFVATATIGMDHLDIDCLRHRGIEWTSAPGCNADSVMNYIASALLEWATAQNRTLDGQTLAVIGCGNVGSRVARLGEALGMRVLRNDPPLAREQDGVYIPLDDALAQADIVTLHVPLTRTGQDPTFQLANDSFFERLKHGALFINSSRGKVGSDEAILRALEAGRISGAILDVWETEPLVRPELHDAAFLATPHIAGYSLEGKFNGTRMCFEAAARFLGVEAQWDLQLPPANPECFELDCAAFTETEALRTAAQQIYAIREDDRRMREALTSCNDEAQRPAAFDQLRKTYPVRREYSAARIELKNPTRSLEGKLRALGFQI